MPATGRPSFFLSLAKAGFNYDRMADQQARKNAERPIGELVSSLPANAAKSAPMPGLPERLTVGHVAIHTQDVRGPNDLPGKLDDDVLLASLDFVTTDKMGTGLADIPNRDSVTFTADDLDWSSRSGPYMSGPAESLLMALAGRDPFDELSGEGLELVHS